MTAWSVEAEGWSSGAVGMLSSGVSTEDLRDLPLVTQDVGSELMGLSVEVIMWDSRSIEETREGAFLEDPRVLTLGFVGSGFSFGDKGVSEVFLFLFCLVLGHSEDGERESRA